ncbi:MAG: KxYKxGKxW signal peptide domain-containing protein [Streptococcus salivarius]
MGKKVHYKLHKVKKQWVTIAVTSAALASIVGGATVANQKVSADETTEPVATTTAESDVVVETHEVATPAATATTDATTVTNDKAAATDTEQLQHQQRLQLILRQHQQRLIVQQ